MDKNITYIYWYARTGLPRKHKIEGADLEPTRQMSRARTRGTCTSSGTPGALTAHEHSSLGVD